MERDGYGLSPMGLPRAGFTRSIRVCLVRIASPVAPMRTRPRPWRQCRVHDTRHTEPWYVTTSACFEKLRTAAVTGRSRGEGVAKPGVRGAHGGWFR